MHNQKNSKDYDKWQKNINSWKKSPLTTKAFCKQKGIVLATYYRWHKKTNNTAKELKNIATTSFVEVIMKEEDKVLVKPTTNKMVLTYKSITIEIDETIILT